MPDCFARIEIGTDETIDTIRVRAAQLDNRLTVRDIEGAAALLRSMPTGLNRGFFKGTVV